MTTRKTNLDRRLEISERIEYLEERICVFPIAEGDIRPMIKKLKNELRRLELKARRRAWDTRLN